MSKAAPRPTQPKPKPKEKPAPKVHAQIQAHPAATHLSRAL